MPNGPTTWGVLTAVQQLVLSEVLINGVTPFSPLNSADQATYGVANAVIIGPPKIISPSYTQQMHICLPANEAVYRRAFGGVLGGGKVWDEIFVYCVALYNNTKSWYQSYQNLVALRDQMHYVMMQHTEMPRAGVVAASKEMAHTGGAPTGFFHDERIGRDWDCWGFMWWLRSEWLVAGGFIS